MFTSGSTGHPKGIEIPHRAIVRLARNSNFAPLSAHQGIAHISNPAFDAATYEIWGSLLNGGYLVILDRDDVLDIERFVGHLQSGRIHGMFLTAALFTQIAHQKPDAFRHLRYLLVGGDAMDPQATRKVLDTAPPGNLRNGYGPTEGTTFSCWYPAENLPDEAQIVEDVARQFLQAFQ